MINIKNTCYKGTRILLGSRKRNILNRLVSVLQENGYEEIQIPVIQYSETFKNKVGKQNSKMMFTFKDKGDRDLCLAPEYTAVIQQLSNTYFKNVKDKKVFYIQECFRGEKPQKGRYRQFTQLGVEVLNPTDSEKTLTELKLFSQLLCLCSLSEYYEQFTDNEREYFSFNEDVKRGLDYYKDGEGFEISCNNLGSSKQVCGGGIYDGGVGFALGIDRLLLINDKTFEKEDELDKDKNKLL